MHHLLRGPATVLAGLALAACSMIEPAYLRAMPKGGDLHNHLSSTVYAESFIALAIADGRCLIAAEQVITPSPCDAEAGRPPVAEAVESTNAYNRLIDALSTRNYALHEVSGHDRFFGTFARFGGAEGGRDGELILGLVPPEDQRFHIREAVEAAGARRIGHGIDLLYEDRSYQLLRRMAEGDAAVEINLTSNDVIPGVVGDEHPFETYRAHGVPQTLSTADKGKAFSRNALTYAVLAGDSLWVDPRAARPVATCAPDRPGSGSPSAACAAFLSGSGKATGQWHLDAAFAGFETGQAAL